MKAFFLSHKKLHLWLLADLALLALFLLLRPVRPAMEALAGAMARVRLAIAGLAYRTEVSVMEVLIIAVLAVSAGYVIWSVIAVCHAEKRLRRLYSAVLGAGCGALTAVLTCCCLWGANFYIDGFQERSGIYAQDVALEDLYRVTAYFAGQLGETADRVPRDEAGLFRAGRRQILDRSVTVYDAVEAEFPFLTFADKPPKAVHFSRLMSRLDFTGVYCPYTGESNVNMDSPACLLPVTVAHELAHQRGLTSEQECNFLGVLASVTSGDDVYAYSGWLLGYIHLGNALYAADYDRWEQVYFSLPETVRSDLDDNNAYWRQFEDTTVKEVSNQVYDRFLKSYGQEDGMRSYGMVVDLLVAYYKDKI